MSSSDGTNVGKVSPGTENPRRETPLALVALVLVAVDLAVANGWLVASAPERLWHARSAMAEAIRGRSLPGSMPRVYRHPIWMPERWKTTSSADRLAEWIAWDRDTLFPKCNLPERIALTQVEGAMAVGRYDALLARTQGAAALGRSDYAILPPEEPLRDGRPIATAARDARLWQSAVPAARAWIVHGDGPVEAVESARARAAGHESCRVTDIDPQRVEVDAELAAPGRVVLADQFYPGWTADVTSGGGPARRVESEPYRGVMRAVSLPAGRHRVVYRYRPASFVWGAAVSAAGWASLVVVSLFWWTRRRRRPIG